MDSELAARSASQHRHSYAPKNTEVYKPVIVLWRVSTDSTVFSCTESRHDREHRGHANACLSARETRCSTSGNTFRRNAGESASLLFLCKHSATFRQHNNGGPGYSDESKIPVAVITGFPLRAELAGGVPDCNAA